MASPAEVLAALRLGTLVRGYRLVREIGSGGMGVVFEAVHDAIGQRAAVKLLLGDLARAPSYAARFTQEARAACAVRHPGLVQVFDSGQLEDGTPFLLMELLDGQSLRARLLSPPRLTFDEAIRVARQLASALATVHERGIVHRDVKPENVMLVPDDAVEGHLRAKLLDFGIARSGLDATRLTQEGTVIGTAEYMAPEQCAPDGKPTSACDVYALGVVLFEMLDGAPPFVGDASTVMRRHLVEEAPVRRILLLPPQARTLLEEMLAKEASRRPTATDVATGLSQLGGVWSREALSQTEPRSSLRPFSGTLPASDPAPKRRTPLRGRDRRLGALLVGAVTVALAAGLTWRATHRTRAAIVPSTMVRLSGGAFTMGSTSDEIAAECARLGRECLPHLLEREQPPHAVHVSPFYLDVNEATNAEIAHWLDGTRVVVRNDSDTPTPRFVYDETGALLLADTDPTYGGLELLANSVVGVRSGFEERAAVQITWDAARRYCAAQGKRLPTEAERDFAASGVARRRYPWGDEEPRCDGVRYGREDGPCVGQPKGPGRVVDGDQDWSPERVHGLGGNVSEWVEDAFTQPFYEDCGTCNDPVQVAPASANGPPANVRLFRGSAWSNSIVLVRGRGRGRWDRQSLSASLGVRCALSAVE
jgi:formylglycine-generating enzyme required for sulfatase activity